MGEIEGHEKQRNAMVGASAQTLRLRLVNVKQHLHNLLKYWINCRRRTFGTPTYLNFKVMYSCALY